MSSNVYPHQPLEVVHCSPEVLVDAISKPISPETVKALTGSAATAHRRPNPANGAPRPKNHNPVA